MLTWLNCNYADATRKSLMVGGYYGTAYLTFERLFRAYSPSAFFHILEAYVHNTFSGMYVQQQVVVRGGVLYHYAKGEEHEYES